ncbi:uncharacterized protein LOC129960606 isoform X6 [Argiope bruennichi]|uniref:uncharacterized protein LOC129960606 isoform X6 n=1 Tax=Argiope bruennichi TaxID=94029 RepID=UPI0024942EC5|nr:uncharacterized protein LOC129960606 isoform X6 [Argiope bruennichi]
MICIENGYRITKYFLFNALILFPLCFAQDEIELRLENHDWKPPRRHLLWRSSSSSMTGPELAVYIIAVFRVWEKATDIYNFPPPEDNWMEQLTIFSVMSITKRMKTIKP